MLNYDLVGTLIKYNDNGPIRAKLEYNQKYVKPYHDCINFILNKIKPLNTHKIKDYDIDLIHNLINDICYKLKKEGLFIFRIIKHISTHKKT